MAVDVIPEASKELKRVLFVVGQLKDVNKRLGELEKKKLKLKELLPVVGQKNGLILSLKSMIQGVDGQIEVYEEEIKFFEDTLKLLPKLCGNCEGAQVLDFSTSRMMARICSVCGGIGLEGQSVKSKQISAIISGTRRGE